MGVGEDMFIVERAVLVQRAVGLEGEILLDSIKPDGMPRKLLDMSRLHALGWRARIWLEAGVRYTFTGGSRPMGLRRGCKRMAA